MRFKSVCHGTCALGGNHPEGSQYAAECPVLRRQYRDSGPPLGVRKHTISRDGKPGQPQAVLVSKGRPPRSRTGGGWRPRARGGPA